LTPSVVLPDSDQELLRVLRDGEPQAVSLVYQRYGSKMLAFARRYVADDAAAEDVVIDLLHRWLERPPSIRDADRVSAFLATSVYHAAIDWIRRDRTEQGRPPRHDHPSRDVGGQPDVPVGHLAESASHEVLAVRLAAALAQLSDSDRLLLETHYGQALTTDECMSLLAISRTAFHQRLHRARTRLARRLTSEESAAVGEEVSRG